MIFFSKLYCTTHMIFFSSKYDITMHHISGGKWNEAHGVLLVVANISMNIIVDGRQVGCLTPLLQADLCRNSPVGSFRSKICAIVCCWVAVKFIHMTHVRHYEYNVIAGGVRIRIHARTGNRGRR